MRTRGGRAVLPSPWISSAARRRCVGLALRRSKTGTVQDRPAPSPIAQGGSSLIRAKPCRSRARDAWSKMTVGYGATPAAAASQVSGGNVLETGHSGPALAVHSEPPATRGGGLKPYGANYRATCPDRGTIDCSASPRDYPRSIHSRQSHLGSWTAPRQRRVKSAAILDEPSTPEICDRPIRGRLTRPDSKMAGEDPAMYNIPRVAGCRVVMRIRV